MGQANGYFLRLPKDREEVFKECLDMGRSFGEPVPDFSHSRRAPLICFLLSPNDEIEKISLGRPGIKSGTDLKRLNLSDVTEITPAISANELLGGIPKRNLKKVSDRLYGGGLLAPKSFAAVIEALLKIRPDLKPLLDRYSNSYREKIEALPKRARDSLSYQREALLTALSLAKDPRDPGREWTENVQDWSPPDSGAPKSFLEGLPVARVREDPMVVQDLANLPGFDLLKTMSYGAAIFESDVARVTVLLANRQPLEEQTGADLIYFNETFRCFLMVQYKAMEGDNDGKEIFRLPNVQLDKELSRMDQVLNELKKVTSSPCCDGFRLNDNPFFLKLCRRLIFNPDDVAQVDGMYIPLEYWRYLTTDARIIGPKGGKGITYKNVGRYLDNSTFTSMVAKAWIGSTPEQSKVIKDAIAASLELGKAVLIAVKTDKAPDSSAVGTLESELPIKE